jgi:CheB methylesterase
MVVSPGKPRTLKEKILLASNGHPIVVIGTSAGGLEALDELIGQLPAGLQASIFIVQHMAAEGTGEALLHRLGSHSLKCRIASDGESFKNGNIYIARATPTKPAWILLRRLLSRCIPSPQTVSFFGRIRLSWTSSVIRVAST